MTKKWPDRITDLCSDADTTAALKRAVRTFYTFKRTKAVGHTWDGLDLTTSRILCNGPPIAVQLTEVDIKYDAERGRDPLDVVLRCAFQLGIEYALRLKADEMRHHDGQLKFVTMVADLAAEEIEKAPKSIPASLKALQVPLQQIRKCVEGVVQDLRRV